MIESKLFCDKCKKEILLRHSATRINCEDTKFHFQQGHFDLCPECADEYTKKRDEIDEYFFGDTDIAAKSKGACELRALAEQLKNNSKGYKS